MPNFIIAETYVEPIGGNQLDILPQFSHPMPNRRWRPILLCGADGALPQGARSLGGEVHVLRQLGPLNEFGGRDRDLGLWGHVTRIAAVMARGPRLAALLRSLRPAVMLCCNIRSAATFGLVAHYLGIPVVLVIKGELVAYPRGIVNTVFRMASKVLFLSRALRDPRFYDMYKKYPNKFGEIDLGIDFDDVRRSLERRAAGQRPNLPAGPSPRFAFVGRICHAKGVHVLAEAFGRVSKQHPNAQLLLVGPVLESEYRRQVEAIANRHHVLDKCHFLGYRKDVLDIVGEMDALVLPSFTEGMPRVIIEALAVGCPVIATRVGGIEGLLDGGRHGVLVRPDDAEDLERAMLGVAGALDDWRRIGQAAMPEIRARFTVDQHITTLDDRFEEVSGQRTVASA